VDPFLGSIEFCRAPFGELANSNVASLPEHLGMIGGVLLLLAVLVFSGPIRVALAVPFTIAYAYLGGYLIIRPELVANR